SIYLHANTDQTTAVSVEEQTLEVEKTEDEASQTKENKEEVEQNKEEVFEGKDDDDGNSQNKPDPEQLVLMKLKVDVTLKKMHTLTEEEINERTVKMACEMNQMNTHLDELLPRVLLESFIQRPISQDEKNQVIDVYIKALIQYFDIQHRARPDNERIVLAESLPINILAELPMSGFARKICIYDLMVDSKIANAREKKKLSPGHQLIEDQISTILPKMLIWKDFADSSRPPTGSVVKDYGLNYKSRTHFGKCPIQPSSSSSPSSSSPPPPSNNSQSSLMLKSSAEHSPEV
ncbi:hypothetical protein GIB67_024926, partial [Kingdonia uniflora]